MRIATWNCNGAFRRKLEQADGLEADVLVIQECEDPNLSTAEYRDWACDYLWTGSTKSKGIGIFVRNGASIEALNWDSQGLSQFLPARIDGRFDILAVWTQNVRPASLGYIGQFWKYFQTHRHALTQDSLIIGDFNSNSIWDKPRRPWNHSDCVRELEECGFRSLYHLAKNERQGEETNPTFYMYRHKSRPFHIDYGFAHHSRIPDGWAGVSVGDPTDWLSFSDHVPMMFEL
jgi:exonuclease III